MERGSTHHSARLDDALDADTAALTHGSPHEGSLEENRWQEGPADGEPAPDGLPVGDPQPSRFVDLGLDDVEVRSELARSLRPGIFPATAAELVACAEREGTFDWVVDALGDLPTDAIYPTVQAVWVALGGPVEHRDHPITAAPTAAPPPTAAQPTNRASAAEPPAAASAARGPVRFAAPVLAFAARVLGLGLRATAQVLDAAGRRLGA